MTLVCFIILIYHILPWLVWEFVLQRFFFFLSRLDLYSSPESNQWCQANPTLGVVTPVLPQGGWLIYYHFRVNKTNRLIFWIGWSFFFHFCFIVEVCFYLNSISDFVGLALNIMKTHSTPFLLNFFVDHLPIATTSQTGKWYLSFRKP